MFFKGRYAGSKDAELVSLVAQNDEKAFRELLDRHQGGVYRFAARLIGDRHEAQDIAQETFLRFYRSAAKYRPDAALRTYLLRIARNLCIDHLRKKRPAYMDRLPEKESPGNPLEHVEQADSMVRLMRAVESLPANQRDAVLLYHDQDLNYAEIAEAMGLTVSAVESLLVRARRTLRKHLSDDR